MSTVMQTPPAVGEQEWEAARQRLLVREKELTRARDALTAQLAVGALALGAPVAVYGTICPFTPCE
ncbi:MAG: DUF899 family protein [Streptosporangiaceae bacterium]